MAKGMKDDIVTEGVSIGNMSSEEVDAFLSQIVAQDDRSSKVGKKDSRATASSSSETKEAAPSKAGTANPGKAAPTVDVESTLDQVDAQLADLEAMLAEATDGEIDLSVPEEKVPEPQQAPASKSEVAEVQNTATATDPVPVVSEAGQEDYAADTSESQESVEKAQPLPDDSRVNEETASDELPQASAAESTTREDMALAENPSANVEQALENATDHTSAVSAEQSEPVRQNRLRSLPNSLIKITCGLLIQILTIIDLPFARLGRGIKNLIGYAAIATLLVAVGTWVAGSYL